MPAGAPLRAAPVLLVVAGAAGCSGDHNVLDPRGENASRVAGIGWTMFIAAGAVFALVLVALARSVLRRRGRGAERTKEEVWVVAGGVVLPAVVIVALTVLTLGALRSQPQAGAIQVDVTGRQFWWDVKYLQAGVSTANELHIPVGQDVEVTLRGGDVIHSFWVPNLSGKVDMVPGRTNHLVLHATSTGTYRGQCAEFCGLQHANMAFLVHVDEPADYEAWLAHERADAQAPTDPLAQQGEQAFQRLPCASCHQIRGVSGANDRGPDLTHFANRSTIGAGTVPNNRGYLGGWIADAQSTKPGSLMPPIPMSAEDLQALLAYLETLR